jgi:hypothetical protein
LSIWTFLKPSSDTNVTSTRLFLGVRWPDLALTDRDGRRGCVFQHAAEMRHGQKVPLSLSSHPGFAVCILESRARITETGLDANSIRVRRDLCVAIESQHESRDRSGPKPSEETAVATMKRSCIKTDLKGSKIQFWSARLVRLKQDIS